MSITAKQLLEAGIKPGELFGRLLRGCNTIEEAIVIWQESQSTKEQKAKKVVEGSAWQFLMTNEVFRGIPSLESNGAASSSEKRRWLDNGAVVINGKKPKPDDIVEFPITELVLFPNSEKRKCTMV